MAKENGGGVVLRIDDAPGPPSIVVSGHLGSESARTLRAVTGEPGWGQGLVLDLRPCTSIDPPGLGAVIGCIRRCDERGGHVVVLVAKASTVERTIRSHGVGRLARIDAHPMAE